MEGLFRNGDTIEDRALHVAHGNEPLRCVSFIGILPEGDGVAGHAVLQVRSTGGGFRCGAPGPGGVVNAEGGVPFCLHKSGHRLFHPGNDLAGQGRAVVAVVFFRGA